MGGKASIILVLGFGAILGFLSLNMNRIANVSVSNMAMYSDMNAAHALATIGTNVGLAKFYADTGWAGSITQNIDDGTLRGRFTATRSDISANRARLRTVSTYQATPFTTLRDTIDVYFDKTKYNSFAMYAWMTNFEGNVFWITGDTVWGRIHSNGALHVNGSPVFMEKATTSKNFDPRVGTGVNRARFMNGYETGIAEIPLPNDLSELINSSQLSGTPYGRYYTHPTLWATLAPGTSADGDGKIYLRTTSGGAIIDSVNLGDPNFNGALLTTGTLNVQGTLDGRVTLGSLGNIIIQNDCLYERDPLTTTSNDMLGLVSDVDVVVADNTPNRTDCIIQGNIFCRDGSFRAENYNTRGISGALRVLGSIVQDERGAVGQFSGSTLNSGFSKRYRYDVRLNDPAQRPPHYPGYYVRTYAITNWWESYRVMKFQ